MDLARRIRGRSEYGFWEGSIYSNNEYNWPQLCIVHFNDLVANVYNSILGVLVVLKLRANNIWCTVILCLSYGFLISHEMLPD